MIRNIIIYLCLLTGTFLFSIFYYAWFSWFLFLTVVSIPIIKNCLIMPFFGDNADENDVVFAKLMYVCRYMIKSIGICFACDRNGNPFEIRCENDILNYFSALYLNTESNFVADTNDFQHYSIFADREEVDLL